MVVLVSLGELPSFILAVKIKALKKDLKMWNANIFIHIDGQKRHSLGFTSFG